MKNLGMAKDIYNVCWRDMKRYFSHKPRVLFTVFQPLIWLVLVGSVMSGMTGGPDSRRFPDGAGYTDFMTAGVMIMAAMFGGSFSGVSLVWDRRMGFLNKMLAAPMERGSIPMGKALATATQYSVQACIIGLVALALGVRFQTGIPGFIVAIFVAILFNSAIAAISLSLALYVKTPEGLHPILNFFIMPLLFTSNAIFPESAMPIWLRVIADWNPVSHAVTPIRTLITQGWDMDRILPGFALTLLFAVAMWVISARQFERSIA